MIGGCKYIMLMKIGVKKWETFSLSRNLKKRQKDRKMSLVKEEAKEDSEEAVGLIKKVGFQDRHKLKSESCLNHLYSVSDESSII